MADTTKENTFGSASSNQKSVGGVTGLASSQEWEAGSIHCDKSSKPLRKFRIGSLNVNTLRGRVSEVVEMATRRKVDVCFSKRPDTGVVVAEQLRAKT